MTLKWRFQGDRRHSASLVTAASVAVGMVAWSTVSISALGVPWWRFLLALLVTALVCWGLGGAAQSSLGVPGDERHSPLPRLAIGFAVATTLITLLAQLRIGPLFVGLAVVVLSAVCWVFLLRRRTREISLPHLTDAADWMLLAVLLRVCTAGSQFMSIGPTTVRLTQFWDLPFHLAYVKEGLFRGIPVSQSPLLAGAAPLPYHPAFDDLATVLIKGLGLPVDAGFYCVVLPLLGVAFVAALMAVTSYATGSRRAPYFTLFVLAGFPALAFALPRLSALSGIPDVTGYVDADLVAYFVISPPGAVAAVAAATSIALFARAASVHSKSCLVGAAILAGATVCMKANTALALGPAFVCAAGVLAWRRRDMKLFATSTLGALVAAVLCYLPTRGYGGAQMGVDLGAFARYARPGGNPVVALWSRVTARFGVFGDALFLMGHVVGSLFAWRAIPALFAVFRRPRLASTGNEGRASAANAYLLWFIVWATVVGFTVVQIDVGRFSAWNISYHTMANVAWVGVVLAGIGFYRIARRVLGPRARRWLLPVALAILVSLTPLTMWGVEDMRQVDGPEIDASLYELLRKVPEYTGPDTVVAQNFDTERNAWVSGIAGRPAVLERAETWWAYQPAEAQRRTELLSALYGAPTPAAAREVADDLGVRHAIVGPDDSPVLLEAGVELVRLGDWVLVEFP